MTINKNVVFYTGRTFFAFALAFMLAIAVTHTSAWAKPNPKYASYVIDVKRNIVLHQSHAKERRYPASLTKLMTLYLTFEALEEGKLTPNQKIKASTRAARQPQTNISLNKGDTLTVQQAIDALVVRSANDAAVVLAEAIGKTEWDFAVRMTQKARALGMHDTQFRNPHGLHNSNQYTTAHDIAILAMALRRDFPQYYHNFNKTEFSFKGRTYTTHNKITRFYKGADGLKTGYINASGFNLASSVRRDGQDIVAVVLGGRTSRSRDNHMVDLLDTALLEAGNTNNMMYAFEGGIPTPTMKPGTTTTVASEPTIITFAKRTDAEAPTPIAKPGGTVEVAVAQPAPVEKPRHLEEIKEVLDSVSFISKAHAAEKPLDLTKLQQSGKDWGIQVGTFREASDAMSAAERAVKIAQKTLDNSIITVTNKGDTPAGVHRARLAGLSKTQAKTACDTLKSSNQACFVYKLSQLH